MNYRKVCNDIFETNRLAQDLEAEKFPNMIICLDGELGAGKTTFVKAFAQAMGIKENVTSPTFTLIKEYHGELDLFHMDVYRLEGNADGLGIEEYFHRGGVVIIEWADSIKDDLPEERLDIVIKVIDDEKRSFYITPHGKQYEELCESVL